MATSTSMEVLLLQDIQNVGKKNDLLSVGDGYALNFLLPRRKAIAATPAVRKVYAEAIKARLEEREKEKALQAGKLTALADITLSFKKKTTKTGKLYAAISEKVIADALKSEHKLNIAEDAISTTEPIKTTGTFAATVKLGKNMQNVKIIVEAVEHEEADLL